MSSERRNQLHEEARASTEPLLPIPSALEHSPGRTLHESSTSPAPARYEDLESPDGGLRYRRQLSRDAADVSPFYSPRFLDRDAPFFQSRGRWNVRHISRSQARLHHHNTPGEEPRRLPISKHLWNNWFHTLAYQKTIMLMFIIFLSYSSIVFMFAFVYLGVSKWGERQDINPDGSTQVTPFCDMDIHDHMEALYFSLSTMTTIGYGVSDYYFGGCWTPLLLVLAQACFAIAFNAVAIGLLFQRISRGHNRGKSVLFSGNSVIRRVRGVPHLQFRVGELRRHQILEATVRAYCIRHERHNKRGDHLPSQDSERVEIETTYFVTKPVKLIQDDLSSHILMSLPQVLVHSIDQDSPLLPPKAGWYDASGYFHESFGNGTEIEYIRAFLRDREAEIVVLVEGTDELTGTGLQSRHSYAVGDLLWNHAFAPCVFPSEANDSQEVSRNSWWHRRSVGQRSSQSLCVVDFARFHDTVEVDADCNDCPYVQE